MIEGQSTLSFRWRLLTVYTLVVVLSKDFSPLTYGYLMGKIAVGQCPLVMEFQFGLEFILDFT